MDNTFCRKNDAGLKINKAYRHDLYLQQYKGSCYLKETAMFGAIEF